MQGQGGDLLLFSKVSRRYCTELYIDDYGSWEWDLDVDTRGSQVTPAEGGGSVDREMCFPRLGDPSQHG